LNPTCYDIMFLLMQKFPQPISKRDIEWHIWGDDPPEEDIIRKHIYHLRSAVDKPFETPVIKTLPKVGYILEIDE
ncbi:MAG: helix-turn-helix domain-containing protein, partial [Pseudomonadota bacterium]